MSMKIGDALGMLLTTELPGRFIAYDGSSVGTGEVDITLHLKTRRGLAYLLTAPGDLGLARAYVMGDLDILGVHPGDPYDALMLLYRNLKFRAPTPAEALQIVRGLGWSNLRPPPCRRRRRCRAGAVRSRACATRWAATPTRSTTTTTSPTASTSWCWVRR